MLSVRVSKEDERLIKNYAASKEQSVSELLRQLVFEKIEEEYDMDIVKEYLNNKDKMTFHTADEVEKELGL